MHLNVSLRKNNSKYSPLSRIRKRTIDSFVHFGWESFMLYEKLVILRTNLNSIHSGVFFLNNHLQFLFMVQLKSNSTWENSQNLENRIVSSFDRLNILSFFQLFHTFIFDPFEERFSFIISNTQFIHLNFDNIATAENFFLFDRIACAQNRVTENRIAILVFKFYFTLFTLWTSIECRM